MSPVLLLVGLLVLSYTGSLFAVGRTLRGIGLSSSVEYAVLGFVLGPQVLGVLGHEMLATFEPLAQVAFAWLSLVVGLDCGLVGDRRAGIGSMALGLFNGIFTCGAVAAGVWLFVTRVQHAPRDLEHVLLAGGIGAVCAETTRHSIRWASERYGAKGKVTSLLFGFAHVDDLVPLVATAALFALTPVPLLRTHFAPWVSVAVTIGFGVALGMMTAMHLGRELRVAQTWGVLLGVSFLGIGVAARLGMSGLTVLFFMGLTTATLSRHRVAIRAMVAPVERPAVLPALVLAGAHVDFRASSGIAALVAVAVLVRCVAKLLFGAAISVPCKASPLLGGGLLSSGALSMGLGLAFAIRYTGPVGQSVLLVAFVACIVGELLGPLTLRRVLRRAGEIEPTEVLAS